LAEPVGVGVPELPSRGVHSVEHSARTQGGRGPLPPSIRPAAWVRRGARKLVYSKKWSAHGSPRLKAIPVSARVVRPTNPFPFAFHPSSLGVSLPVANSQPSSPPVANKSYCFGKKCDMRPHPTRPSGIADSSALRAFDSGTSAAISSIVFQMGRARLAARGTTLKSTTLARPEARLIVLSAGTTR
jgi:hypothetical protein